MKDTNLVEWAYRRSFRTKDPLHRLTDQIHYRSYQMEKEKSFFQRWKDKQIQKKRAKTAKKVRDRVDKRREKQLWSF